MATLEETIQKLNDSIAMLVDEDPVKNIDLIKELTRSIQRLKKVNRWQNQLK